MIVTVITLVVVAALLTALALSDAAAEARRARKHRGYEGSVVGMRVTFGSSPDGFD